MRFIIALLGLLVLAPSAAHAYQAERDPNSKYNGTHYVSEADYVQAVPRHAHKSKRVHRSHPANTHRGHSGKRARQHSVGSANRVAVFKPDLSNIGKGWMTFGGRLVHVGEEAVLLPFHAVTQVVKTALSLVERTIQFFIGKGYSKNAAYAIAGHLRAESNFNTRDVGDGGRARYLAQWHPDRQAGLKRLAAKKGVTPYDFETNLEYIDHELRTSEGLAYRELHRAKSLDDAVAAFAHFERPRGYTVARPKRIHDFGTRLRFAKQYAREHPEVSVPAPDFYKMALQ